jgi:hypothetical protein
MLPLWVQVEARQYRENSKGLEVKLGQIAAGGKGWQRA